MKYRQVVVMIIVILCDFKLNYDVLRIWLSPLPPPPPPPPPLSFLLLSFLLLLFLLLFLLSFTLYEVWISNGKGSYNKEETFELFFPSLSVSSLLAFLPSTIFISLCFLPSSLPLPPSIDPSFLPSFQ